MLGVAFMCGCAAAQWLLQSRYGSFPEFLWHHGLVHEHVARGEWWRLIVGPLWHSGFVHWSTNFALLLFALPMAHVLARQRAYLWFLVALLATSLVSFVTRTMHGLDATAGISGAVFGLLGGACATAWLNRTELPRSLPATLAATTLGWIALAALLNPKSNDLGHVAGVLAGVVTAWLTLRLRTSEGAASTP